MTIGINRSKIESDITWELTTGFDKFDRKAAAKIAKAIAKVIDENNRQIEAHLRRAA